MWGGIIIYRLPKLQYDLQLLFEHFQQYAQHFQESVIMIQTLDNVGGMDAAAIQVNQSLYSHKEFFLFVQHSPVDARTPLYLLLFPVRELVPRG